MERRRLGETDMVAGILGFGGSEIGYQQVGARTVARLLGTALDAGLNVIDTAECYDDSEVLIGRALGARRRECYLFTKCGHSRGGGRADRRPPASGGGRAGRKRAEPYYQEYGTRLRALDYPFLRGAPDAAVATALRFTLSAPGVHSAIVGTTKPERWQQNATLLGAGALPAREFERIRARWREVAEPSWAGQV